MIKQDFSLTAVLCADSGTEADGVICLTLVCGISVIFHGIDIFSHFYDRAAVSQCIFRFPEGPDIEQRKQQQDHRNKLHNDNGSYCFAFRDDQNAACDNPQDRNSDFGKHSDFICRIYDIGIGRLSGPKQLFSGSKQSLPGLIFFRHFFLLLPFHHFRKLFF